jgi:pilus assembly protein CpaF
MNTPWNNPYGDHQSYEDNPWEAALTTGQTQGEVFVELVAALRERIQIVGTFTTQDLEDPDTGVEQEVRQIARSLIEKHNESAPAKGAPELEEDIEVLASRMVDEVLGWGPLSPYMRDDEVEEVILNNYDQGFVIFAGGRKAPLRGFHDPMFAREFFNRKIEAGHGQRVTNASPFQDARLPDGSRLFVAVPPVAGTDLQVVIRRFRPVAADLDALLELGTINPPLQAFLDAAARAHLTMVIAGGTGTGKTTFLQALTRSFPDNDRVVTIEDTPELQLDHLPDWAMQYVRHASEGVTEIGMAQLVRNALRMRPTRIILGEARGGEMVDILTACNTGHEGTLFTVHANSVRETVDRMVTMYRMGRDLAPDEVRKEIVAALRLIVHLRRTATGLRYVAGIGEIRRIEGTQIVVEPIFESQQDGQVATFTGNYPACREILEERLPGFDFRSTVIEAGSTGFARQPSPSSPRGPYLTQGGNR